MSNELSQTKIMAALDWAYDKAVDGVAGLDSASEIAESCMEKHRYPVRAGQLADPLAERQGRHPRFHHQPGRFLVMPLTIPANLASVMYVQIRMISAIAHIGGHDLRDDRVKTLVYSCMAGNAAKDILKDVGIQVGKKLTQSAIKNISGKTLTAINQTVGFRLLTKFGEKGLINLGKTIPLVGGVIGAGFDIASTNLIGNIARDTFIEKTD